MRKIALLLLLPLLLAAASHKFYVSVTHVNYSEKSQSLQVTSRLFIDDVEDVLYQRYEVETFLATPEEDKAASEYLERYVRRKLVFKINGEVVPYEFLGRDYDNDIVRCYIEITGVDLEKVKSMEVENELLTDLFEDQQNVVHFQIGDTKKSFVLMKSRNSGMLNL